MSGKFIRWRETHLVIETVASQQAEQDLRIIWDSEHTFIFMLCVIKLLLNKAHGNSSDRKETIYSTCF